MKKYLAEMVGTMVLVLMGCGTAVSLACGADTASIVGTALAFGLAVIAMAYTIGNISGCHINPAITLGVWLSGRMKCKEALCYMAAQVIGAIVGAAILFAVTAAAGIGFGGANTCESLEGNQWAGVLVEAVLTFIFVLVVLGTTDSEKGAGNLAGLAIGLTLVLIHLVGIRYTGTSVNPARSIGPAIFAGGAAVKDLWVFIAGPFAGAALSALCWNCLASECKK